MILKNSKLLVFPLLLLVGIAFVWHKDNENALDSVVAKKSDTALGVSNKSFVSKIDDAQKTVQKEVNTIESVKPQNAVAVVAVKGTVVDQLNQSVSGLQIEISRKNTAGGQQNIYTATTDSDGEFVVSDVPPGSDYRLEAIALGRYSGLTLNNMEVRENMDPITVTLQSIELVSVDGMIVDVDHSPVADFEILVRNVGMAYPGSKVISDSSGFFQLNEFPAGDLQLSTTGNDHFNINGISVQAGEYQNLTLMLDKGSYHLSGWVSDDLGAPILQARVVLTTDFAHEGMQSSSYRFRMTDTNGGFAFSGIGGHEHKLVIDATGYESRTVNYQFQSFSDNLRIELKRL